MPAILKFNARAGLAGFVKVAPDGRIRGWIVDVYRPGSRLDLRLTRGGHVIEHARTPTTGLLASTSLGLASHSFTFDPLPVPVGGSADIFLDVLGADLSTLASVELQFTLPVKPRAPHLPPSLPDDAGDRAVLPVPPKPATAKVPKIGPRPGEYQRWIAEFDSLDDADRAHVAADMASWIEPPLISLVLLSGKPGAQDQTILSLSEQLYPHWELILQDRPTDANDPRLRVVEGHALRDAVLASQGHYLSFVAVGDVLPPHALYTLAWATRQPDLAGRALYSDEDNVDTDGTRHNPCFKGVWNPDLLLGQDYASRLALLPRNRALDLVAAAGDPERDWSGVYGLTLRLLTDHPDAQPHRLPHVLYHRRQPAAVRPDASIRLVEDVLGKLAAASGDPNPIVELAPSGHRRVIWPLPSPAPLVSLLVPTRDRVGLLRATVDGVRHGTDYPDVEILILDNDSEEPETFAYFDSMKDDPRVRVLHCPGPFNYSRINNLGAGAARGSVLGLLNNDLRITDPGWLREMVGQAMRPGIGAVGAMLVYDNGTVQHAGVVLGIGGVGSHILKRQDPQGPGYHERLAIAQDVSAVTGACLLMHHDVWDKVGGLDEALPVGYQDVDLCLRVRQAGYRIVWTPFAVLDHLESATRGLDDNDAKRARLAAEREFMIARWADLLDDPFFSPNLSLTSLECRPAFPPRVVPPWQTRPSDQHDV